MSRTTIPRIRGLDIPCPPVTAPLPGPAGPVAVGFHTAEESCPTTVVTPLAHRPRTPPGLAVEAPMWLIPHRAWIGRFRDADRLGITGFEPVSDVTAAAIS